MARFKNPLNHVEVAAPCTAGWDQMVGSERVRFCGQCNLNVFNLSAMSRDEAEALIARTEGRLCVKFYRRSDGSIITSDCPVGLRAIHRRVSYLTKAILAAGLTFLASIGLQSALAAWDPPEHTVGIMVRPESPVVAPPRPETQMMGKVVSRMPRSQYHPR
jgi:hypothetical protein